MREGGLTLNRASAGKERRWHKSSEAWPSIWRSLFPVMWPWMITEPVLIGFLTEVSSNTYVTGLLWDWRWQMNRKPSRELAFQGMRHLLTPVRPAQTHTPRESGSRDFCLLLWNKQIANPPNTGWWIHLALQGRSRLIVSSSEATCTLDLHATLTETKL